MIRKPSIASSLMLGAFMALMTTSLLSLAFLYPTFVLGRPASAGLPRVQRSSSNVCSRHPMCYAFTVFPPESGRASKN